ILVAGKTVYTLQPGKRACAAACRRDWPPVLLPHGVRAAKAGPGVDPAKLGTAKAGKGRLQITYDGRRLYWSAMDKAPAQGHGNVATRWGTWSTVAATPSGLNPTTTPAPTTIPSTETTPATSPPATQPTSPPSTQLPATSSPGNGGIGF